MSGFNPQQQQQRMRMMYSNQQQYGPGGPSMNTRMPMGGQNMGPMGPNPNSMQGQIQGQGMRPMGMRPQGMSPQHSQMMQQQQSMHQQQQQPLPSPQQTMGNQPQQQTTPMSQGETMTTAAHSPNIGATTPSGQDNQQTQQPQQQQQQQGHENVQQQSVPQQPQQPITTATVCRIGQETIHEIVTRTCEIFGYLRQLQPPSGSQLSDKDLAIKQARLQDVLHGITKHFKRLRYCWEKAIDQTAGYSTTQLESLIPLKDEREMKNEIEKKRGEAYRQALEEHNQLVTQLMDKNRHIKEIIDQMRNIIWEINTMLAMR